MGRCLNANSYSLFSISSRRPPSRSSPSRLLLTPAPKLFSPKPETCASSLGSFIYPGFSLCLYHPLYRLLQFKNTEPPLLPLNASSSSACSRLLLSILIFSSLALSSPASSQLLHSSHAPHSRASPSPRFFPHYTLPIFSGSSSLHSFLILVLALPDLSCHFLRLLLSSSSSPLPLLSAPLSSSSLPAPPPSQSLPFPSSRSLAAPPLPLGLWLRPRE